MANTPSLKASRRFFLCLIFVGSAMSTPPSAPAGSPRGRR